MIEANEVKTSDINVDLINGIKIRIVQSHNA